MQHRGQRGLVQPRLPVSMWGNSTVAISQESAEMSGGKLIIESIEMAEIGSLI